MSRCAPASAWPRMPLAQPARPALLPRHRTRNTQQRVACFKVDFSSGHCLSTCHGQCECSTISAQSKREQSFSDGSMYTYAAAQKPGASSRGGLIGGSEQDVSKALSCLHSYFVAKMKFYLR